MLKSRRTNRVALALALAFIALVTDALVRPQINASAWRTSIIDGREVVEGEVIVRYRADAGPIGRERAEFQAGGEPSETVGHQGARRLRSRQLSTQQMLAALRSNPAVEYVEPNYVIRANAVPNDPSFNNLWGLLNTGQFIDGRNGTPGADINVVPAWDLTTGSRANIVAILDTGVDATHPDLAGNLFFAPRQFTVTISGAQLTCPAGTRGFNAMLNTCNAVDDNGHGTHVAGIIGAIGNNNLGVTGINWTANLLPLKVLDSTGTGTTTDAIEAIEFAIGLKNTLGADGNVRILNASWGGGVYSQALNDAIQAANNNNMLMVASAGSGGNNNDLTPHYPASSSVPNVISVAAVDNTGELAPYSNYGASSVDLAAPGASTLSTMLNGTYDYLGGTSIAAPFVSGTAALLLGACPSNTATLKATLLANVEPVATLNGKTVSGGRVNAGRALQNCMPTLTGSISGGTVTAVVGNGPGHPNDWVGLFCPATLGDAGYTHWKYLNNTTVAPSTGIRNATVTFPAPASGECNVRLFGFSPSGKIVTSENFSASTTPSLSIGDVSVAEGNSGTTTATFTVSLSPVNPSQAVTVNYATGNGSATAGSDYTTASGTLTFPASTATRTISVTVQGDATTEPDENFLVTLSGATNAIIGDSQATGTITNDDGAVGPSVTVTTPNVAPGGTISFNVAGGPANPRDWVALVPVSSPDTAVIAWKYLNGTNTAPATGMASASLTFTAPQTIGTYDIRFFTNDTYNRIARSSGINVGNGPSLTINDVSVAEGNSGTTVATFTVTMAPVNASQTVTVNYATANGSATAGSDYVAASGTLTFAPSVATQTISVTINGDATNEANETFVVSLSGAANAAIGDTQGTGTITNDDGPAGPSITINTPSVAPGGTISFSISNSPGNPTDWVSIVGAAAPDSPPIDWFYLNGAKTAPGTGITNATLTFTAPQATGSYDIRLFSNNTYTRIARSSAITVANGPSLTINDVSVAEGNSGTTVATFTVTMSPVNASQTVTVNYATANGSATAGSDYTAANGTLTFPPSTATQTISVNITGDAVNEANETFTVNLSGAANAAIGDAQGVGTITNDDGPAGPSITINTPNVAPGGTISFTVSGSPGNPTDWVSIVGASAPDSPPINWAYLNGSKTAPATGLTNATLTFTAPATVGSYDIRLFINNTYTRIARSSPITVANAPTLTINDVSVNEGNSGTTVATFTVTMAPVNASQTVTVDYATANGSATIGADNVAASGTLTFAPSTATQTISVTINGDTTNEANETFFVNLSNAVNAVIGDAQGVGTIINDDGPAGPSVSVTTLNVQPGGTISFTVSGGPGNATDWVGLYAVSGADAGGQLQWKYLNGQNTAPASGLTNASLTFTAPATAGSYNIRFFASNGYTKLATSATITVAP